MRFNTITARVQYDDWTGTAAADAAIQGLPNLIDVFKSAGLDQSEFYPFAFSFSVPEATQEPPDAVNDKCLLRAHCVSVSEIGATEEKILAAAEQNDGVIPTYYFTLKFSIQDFFALFKRFQIMLLANPYPKLPTGRFTEDVQGRYDLDEESDLDEEPA